MNTDCDNCQPVTGFEQGDICPKCSKPFRSVKGNARPTKEEIDSYLDKLVESFKQDPQYELKVEFGKFLTRHIDSLSHDERKRYDELKQILCAIPN